MKTDFWKRHATILGLALVAIRHPALGGDIDPVLVGAHATANGFYAVAVSERHAYVAAGAEGLQVFDISNPGTPRQIGRSPTPGDATDVVVSGQYACVSRSSCCVGWGNFTPAGFDLFDISDPANPRHVASRDGPAWVGAIQDSRVFLLVAPSQDWEGGVEVLDVSNPAAPRPVGRYTSDSPKAVALEGQHLYLAKYSGMLEVIDVSDPAQPKLVGQCEAVQLFSGGGGIALSGNYAYVIGVPFSGGLTLDVINVSNPANPQPVSRSRLDGYLSGLSGELRTRPIVVSSHYAYLATSEGLQILDLSDPTKPQLVTRIRGASGVAVTGNYTYVAGGSGLSVFDVFKPAIAQRRGSYDTTPGPALALAVSGSHAYVASWQGRFQVIDVSDPARPRRVGQYNGEDSGDPGFTPWGVAVSESYAYVVHGRLQVLDVSDPTNPRRVGGYVSSNFFPSAVAVRGNHVCLLSVALDEANREWQGQLEIVDISNKANPRLVGTTASGPTAQPFPERRLWVVVSGNYAYVAGGHIYGNGLQIFDIADQANPRRVGAYDAGQFVSSAAVSGSYLFLSVGQNLEAIDVSDPTRPQRVGRYLAHDYRASKIAVSGNHAFVTSVRSGLDVIDVSHPATMRRVGGNPLAVGGEDIVFSHGKVFLGAGYAGLAILELLPFMKSITKEGPNVKLEWEGFGPARLQRATRLANPDWLDLPGFEGTNTATLPTINGAELFRLVRP